MTFPSFLSVSKDTEKCIYINYYKIIKKEYLPKEIDRKKRDLNGPISK